MLHIGGFSYVGDLSMQDADIIAKYAKQSKNILEFGAGASTQIIAQSLPDYFLSVETDQGWVDLTKQKLDMIDKKSQVKFCDYENSEIESSGKIFDMIFVDGVDHLRLDFALKFWKFLSISGVMLFHDTRRYHDASNVCQVLHQFHNEISMVCVNEAASNCVSSNITVLHKKIHEPWVNWQTSEGKPPWAYGLAPMPENAPLWKNEENS